MRPVKILAKCWAPLVISLFAIAAQAQELVIGSGVYSGAAGGAITITAPVMGLVNMGAQASATVYAMPTGEGTASAGGSPSTISSRSVGVVPIAGTVSNLYVTLPNNPGAGTTVTPVYAGTVNSAQVGTSPTGSTVAALAAGNMVATCTQASPSICNDTSHSDHVAAGTFMSLKFTTGTTPWAQSISSASFTVSADDGTSSLVMAGQSGNTPSTTASSYAGLGYAAWQTTEATVDSVMPTAGTFSGMFVYPETNSSATGPRTYNLVVNGSSTSIGCTESTTQLSSGCCVQKSVTGNMGGNTSAACVLSAAGSGIHVSAGDTVSVVAACPSAACASNGPAFSLVWTPDTQGQNVAFSQVNTNPTNAAPLYTGANGGSLSTAATTNAAVFSTVPHAYTISNYTYCMGVAPGSTATRAAQLYFGTTQGSSPLSVAPLNVTIVGTATCPGAGDQRIGGQTSGTTQSVSAGNTLITNFTAGASPAPAASTRNDVSMVLK